MAEANTSSVQQANDAQHLDNMTSLQQGTPEAPSGARADAPVQTSNVGSQDGPSQLNAAPRGASASNNNLESNLQNSRFGESNVRDNGNLQLGAADRVTGADGGESAPSPGINTRVDFNRGETPLAPTEGQALNLANPLNVVAPNFALRQVPQVLGATLPAPPALQTGEVIEAGGVDNKITNTPTATGLLADGTGSTFTAVATPTASASGYGTYTMDADGTWHYTLNNSNTTVQAINVDETLTDTFTVSTIDGTTQTVTITIDGRNDVAVISGTHLGNVIEAGGINNTTVGIPTATGILISTDVDNVSTFTAVATPTASASGYGTYTMDADGTWHYTLNNSNTTVQAINVDETLTDTFTVSTIDGTTQTVTITIDGRNDVAVISGDGQPTSRAYPAAISSAFATDPANYLDLTPASVVADKHSNLIDLGAITVADVDANQSKLYLGSGSVDSHAGNIGNLTLNADGLGGYTYVINNVPVNNINIGQTFRRFLSGSTELEPFVLGTVLESFNAGHSHTDTFTVQSFDRSATADLTFTIDGTQHLGGSVTNHLSPGESLVATTFSSILGLDANAYGISIIAGNGSNPYFGPNFGSLTYNESTKEFIYTADDGPDAMLQKFSEGGRDTFLISSTVGLHTTIQTLSFNVFESGHLINVTSADAVIPNTIDRQEVFLYSTWDSIEAGDHSNIAHTFLAFDANDRIDISSLLSSPSEQIINAIYLDEAHPINDYSELKILRPTDAIGDQELWTVAHVNGAYSTSDLMWGPAEQGDRISALNAVSTWEDVITVKGSASSTHASLSYGNDGRDGDPAVFTPAGDPLTIDTSSDWTIRILSGDAQIVVPGVPLPAGETSAITFNRLSDSSSTNNVVIIHDSAGDHRIENFNYINWHAV